jgi:hypothetical protein
MQLVDQCPPDARIVIRLSGAGLNAQSLGRGICSVLMTRVNLGTSQLRSRYLADHGTTTVFLLPFKVVHHSWSMMLPKSTKVSCFHDAMKQEGFDCDGAESRSETDGAAIAIFSISPEAVGLANGKTAGITDGNRGPSAHRIDPEFHAGG